MLISKDIHIPIYCENQDLFDSSSLVLDSIRSGFPGGNISVYLTGNNPVINHELALKAFKVDARVFKFDNIKNNSNLISKLCVFTQSFVVIDGDVIFWDSCEDIETSGYIAGRYIPEYKCPFTRTITKARLHTSFLIFNSTDFIRNKTGFSSLVSSFIPVDYINPFIACDNRVETFYDTCANLYHAFGGEHFSENILDRYDHLGCSSFIEELENKCGGPFNGSTDFHKNIQKNVAKVKGLWKVQDKFYADRS